MEFKVKKNVKKKHTDLIPPPPLDSKIPLFHSNLEMFSPNDKTIYVAPTVTFLSEVKTEVIFCCPGPEISAPIQNSRNLMMINSFRHKKRLEVDHYDSREKIFYNDLSRKRVDNRRPKQKQE